MKLFFSVSAESWAAPYEFSDICRDAEEQTVQQRAVCICGGPCIILGASSLWLLKLVWPLNIIEVDMGSAVPAFVKEKSTFNHTLEHVVKERECRQITDKAHIYTTQTHIFDRGVKSRPTTPHWSYLHNFDVNLRDW